MQEDSGHKEGEESRPVIFNFCHSWKDWSHLPLFSTLPFTCRSSPLYEFSVDASRAHAFPPGEPAHRFSAQTVTVSSVCLSKQQLQFLQRPTLALTGTHLLAA